MRLRLSRCGDEISPNYEEKQRFLRDGVCMDVSDASKVTFVRLHVMHPYKHPLFIKVFLGSLGNDDVKRNEKVKRGIGLVNKTTTLNVYYIT